MSQQTVQETSPARVRIRGLDKLDARELGVQLGDDVAFEKEELTADKTGEPATLIAVVVLTAMGIKVLYQYLMKQRSRSEMEIRIEVETRDGTRTVKTVKFLQAASSPPSAEEIEELAAALDVDPKVIAQALAG